MRTYQAIPNVLCAESYVHSVDLYREKQHAILQRHLLLLQVQEPCVKKTYVACKYNIAIMYMCILYVTVLHTYID